MSREMWKPVPGYEGRYGQVIVCEGEGADWLPFQPLYDVYGTAKDGENRKQSVEHVWERNIPAPPRHMKGAA